MGVKKFLQPKLQIYCFRENKVYCKEIPKATGILRWAVRGSNAFSGLIKKLTPFNFDTCKVCLYFPKHFIAALLIVSLLPEKKKKKTFVQSDCFFTCAN